MTSCPVAPSVAPSRAASRTRLVRRVLLASVGLALGFSAAASAAPPVLDRVPSDALVVITTPSLDRLEKTRQTITTSLPLPIPNMGIKELLAMGGMQNGIDTTKPIAIVVMAAPHAPAAKPGAAAGDAGKKKGAEADDEADGDDHETPPAVVLIPTTDYKALLANFNKEGGGAAAGGGGGGVDSVEIMGKPHYLKSLGDGYAALALTKDLAEKFAGKPGNMKAHEEALGKTCGDIADHADLAVIANIPAIKTMAGPELKEHLREMLENSPMGMAMAMQGGEERLDQMQATVMRLMDQTRAVVTGLTVDGGGVALDAAAHFNEGSALGKAFAKSGGSTALLKKLPKQDFLVAGAADKFDPALKEAITGKPAAAAKDAKDSKDKKPAAKDADADGDGNTEEQANAVFHAVMGPLDKADGVAVSIGAVPAAIATGGLLTSTVTYVKTADPDAFVKDSEQALKSVGEINLGGTTFTGSLTPGAPKPNGGASYTTWTLKVNAGDEEPMGAGQALMMLFGPGGAPSGYIAKADGGVVRTLGKNSILMGKALEAAGGKGSVADDTLISQVGEKLPANRRFEGYLGSKTILDMAKAALAFMPGGGGGADVEIPENLPPVGLGLGGGSDGAASARVYVPMPVIKTIAEITQSLRKGAEPENAPPAKGGAGQPKF